MRSFATTFATTVATMGFVVGNDVSSCPSYYEIVNNVLGGVLDPQPAVSQTIAATEKMLDSHTDPSSQIQCFINELSNNQHNTHVASYCNKLLQSRLIGLLQESEFDEWLLNSLNNNLKSISKGSVESFTDTTTTGTVKTTVIRDANTTVTFTETVSNTQTEPTTQTTITTITETSNTPTTTTSTTLTNTITRTGTDTSNTLTITRTGTDTSNTPTTTRTGTDTSNTPTTTRTGTGTSNTPPTTETTTFTKKVTETPTETITSTTSTNTDTSTNSLTSQTRTNTISKTTNSLTSDTVTSTIIQPGYIQITATATPTATATQQVPTQTSTINFDSTKRSITMTTPEGKTVTIKNDKTNFNTTVTVLGENGNVVVEPELTTSSLFDPIFKTLNNTITTTTTTTIDEIFDKVVKNLTEEPSTTQITVMQQENKTEESINTKIIIGAVTLLVACIGLSVAVAAYYKHKRARSARVEQEEADLVEIGRVMRAGMPSDRINNPYATGGGSSRNERE